MADTQVEAWANLTQNGQRERSIETPPTLKQVKVVALATEYVLRPTSAELLIVRFVVADLYMYFCSGSRGEFLACCLELSILSICCSGLPNSGDLVAQIMDLGSRCMG